MMFGESAYYAVLICDTPLAYASVCEVLCDFPIGERSPLDIRTEDPEVIQFLEDHFPKCMEEGLPTSDAILALIETFPPPFSHANILRGRHHHIEYENYQELMRNAKIARMNNRLEIHVTIKSPEQLETTDNLKKFLRFYKKLFIDLAGNEEFVPDDFKTTQALISGKKDIILPEHRTFVLSLPFRDITNSIKLLEIAEHAHHKGPLPFPDPYCLIMEITQPQYMHLLCYAFSELCNAFNGLKWELIVVDPT